MSYLSDAVQSGIESGSSIVLRNYAGKTQSTIAKFIYHQYFTALANQKFTAGVYTMVKFTDIGTGTFLEHLTQDSSFVIKTTGLYVITYDHWRTSSYSTTKNWRLRVFFSKFNVVTTTYDIINEGGLNYFFYAGDSFTVEMRPSSNVDNYSGGGISIVNIYS